jgi:multidrug efflux pump subunit AcrA (membrane-fusion protein)
VEEQAELQAAMKTTIKSKVKGWAALLYLIPEGTAVEEGQLLGELDVSKHQEYRATQAIKVGRARAAMEQAQKNLEILDITLLAAEKVAESQLRIAEMELEKFLGRKADAPASGMPAREGTNLEMVERLQNMLDNEFLDNPDAEVEYAGLADRVRELLGEDNLLRAMGQTANLVLAQIDRISLARADLELKKDTLNHSRNLVEEDFISRNELERDRLAYDSQLSRVTLSWNNIDLLITYTLQQDWIRLKQDVINTELNLENTQARNEVQQVWEQAELTAKELEFGLARERLENVDWQIENSVIYAPHPGVVIYGKQGREWWKPAVEEGNMIRERQNLVVLPDVSRMVAEFTIHESRIEQVSLDQEVTVQVNAFPERMFTGRVTEIGGVASSARSQMSSSALKTYKIAVTLDGVNTDGSLRPGMNATVQILVATAGDVISIPMEAVRRDRNVHYVWKQTPAAPIAQRVVLGVNNLTHVAIEEGLEEGDKVYLDIPAGVEPPTLDQADPSAEPPAEENGE